MFRIYFYFEVSLTYFSLSFSPSTYFPFLPSTHALLGNIKLKRKMSDFKCNGEFLFFLNFIHMHILLPGDDFIILVASKTYTILTPKFVVGSAWSLE